MNRASSPPGDADEALTDAFGRAAPEHFQWQTEGPYVSDRERELVESAFLPLGRRVLDVGCGEGATLHHLGRPAGAVGVDLFEDKIEFARTEIPECEFHAASIYRLPFEDGRFDHVLLRDVIHHLDSPARALDELARVLAPGGRLDVLEPCRNNPLIFLHAVTNRAERGELRSTARFLRRVVSPRFSVESVSTFQAMPIHRALFHPDIGNPRLAEKPLVAGLVRRLERSADRVLPAWVHAYLHVRSVKAG